FFQGRMAESQAKAYNLDLQHSEKVLSMQDTYEAKPTKVKEVLKVQKTSAPRRRRGVVIQDPEEIAVASVIVHTEVKPKDKEKGILIEEPKPLKRKAQIEQDEAFARQLEAELNANINWKDVIDQVKRKEKQDNEVVRYQALKRKPVTEVQAKKNMMIYLKNMAGFKMDFFKGMTYIEIRPIFEKHYNSIQAFLERVDKEDIAKKQRIDEEAEELKRHLHIVANDDDDVYTEATPLASKLVKERFKSTKPKNFSNDLLLNILKIMFKKPNVEADEWRDRKGRYMLAKVKSWKLFESCRVHIITLTTTQMFSLVEKKYTLTRFTLEQMLNSVRLEVEEESEMSLKLL
nr:hypothetical protein [Tanacetum cinerariifolium]